MIIVESVPTGNAVLGASSRKGLDGEDIIERQDMLASSFRDCMADDQWIEETGPYRQKFFQEVTDLAEDVSLCSCL